MSLYTILVGKMGVMKALRESKMIFRKTYRDFNRMGGRYDCFWQSLSGCGGNFYFPSYDKSQSLVDETQGRGFKDNVSFGGSVFR